MTKQWGKEDYIRYTQTPEWKALADTLSYAEGTNGANGYFTQFGGGRFTSKNGEHPDTVIDGGKYKSSAAGRYQFMPFTWKGASTALGGLDIRNPGDQDAAAAYLARNRLMQIGGLASLKDGFTAKVSAALAPEWASLPTAAGTSFYGQPVKKFDDLQAKYNEALKRYKSGEQSSGPESGQLQSPTPQTPVIPTIQYGEDGKSIAVTPPGSGNTTVQITVKDGEEDNSDPLQSTFQSLLAGYMKNVMPSATADYRKILSNKNPYDIDGDIA